MKQNIFETRQRTEELLQQAVTIWQQSVFSEQLEGLEQDPVFTLLMTALAYQSGEMESELERLKAEVLEDYAQMLVPYEVGHAVPATAVVETTPDKDIAEQELNENSVFKLPGTSHRFIPLFKTRVVGATVHAISRLDGRCWKVTLKFNNPIDNLSGFSFAIKDSNFQDVQISVGGKRLPLVSPWDYSQLPLAAPFGLGAMLYNHMYSYNASASCLDLFARHNLRMYFLKKHPSEEYYPKETEKIDLVFEFSGIGDNFVFNKSMLAINSVVLVNAAVNTATLSPVTPIVRVAGSNNSDGGGEQFMHLIRPTDDQIYAKSPVEVRYVSGDRFNSGSLVKLLNALNTKFNTDYYAFMRLSDAFNDDTVQALQKFLSDLTDAAQKDKIKSIPGVYLILRDPNMNKQGSMDISYLTTSGANINQSLTVESKFEVPTGLNGQETRQIMPPIHGSDQMNDVAQAGSLTRYFIATSDRIVTPADIKLFCYNELQTRYGIVRSMVHSITVNHRNQLQQHGCGYEIVVDIQLTSNSYVQRSFADKVPQAEILLQKMMEVRSTNIYPIHVSINIVEGEK